MRVSDFVGLTTICMTLVDPLWTHSAIIHRVSGREYGGNCKRRRSHPGVGAASFVLPAVCADVLLHALLASGWGSTVCIIVVAVLERRQRVAERLPVVS